jgi:hypothetical protein
MRQLRNDFAHRVSVELQPGWRDQPEDDDNAPGISRGLQREAVDRVISGGSTLPLDSADARR